MALLVIEGQQTALVRSLAHSDLYRRSLLPTDVLSFLKRVSDALQSAIKRHGFTFVNAWGLAGLVLAISLRKYQPKHKKEA